MAFPNKNPFLTSNPFLDYKESWQGVQFILSLDQYLNQAVVNIHNQTRK